jgi:hypothetical protein
MCFFIDTPVEKNNWFIGSQSIYNRLLPEFMGEDSGINLDVDILKEILCLEKPQKLSTHNKARHHCYKEN